MTEPALVSVDELARLAEVIISNLQKRISDEPSDTFLDKFLGECVFELLEEKLVESSLADRAMGRGKFSEDEISKMKGWQLKDLVCVRIFGEGGEKSVFGIKNKTNDDSIEFSNIDDEKLRGRKLRQNLADLGLKESSKSTMTLYEALTKSLRQSGVMVESFWQEFFRDPRGFFVVDRGAIEKNKEVWEDALIELSIACMQYVTEGRGNGISDEVIRRQLKSIMIEKGKEILLAASNIETSSDLLLQLIRKKEIEMAEDWIKTIRGLKEQHAKYSEKIERVATAAEDLLKTYLAVQELLEEREKVEKSDFEYLVKEEESNAELAWKMVENYLEKFNKAVSDVQDLHIKQLERQNIPTGFIYFMECIANFIKTRGESFWLPIKGKEKEEKEKEEKEKEEKKKIVQTIRALEMPAMLKEGRKPKLTPGD